MSEVHPSAQSLDLDACAREPIHIPGAIQPHGVLLVVAEPSLHIEQASANTAAMLGIEANALVGRKLSEFLAPEVLASLRAALTRADPAQESPLPVTIAGTAFDTLLHRHDGALIVELEPAPERGETFARHHRRLQHYISEMQRCQSPSGLYAVVARAVSELTGYERVMVYRFDADWHGEVVGEALAGDVTSYMGLHFPASDIPEQARALYARSWLRIIPTVDYTPAALVPPLNPRTSRPLDLSFAALRSVSPIHLEYLRNMEVGASMSISLIDRGKLWGLIACHHRTPRPLPFAVRAACELFGQIASREIAAQTQRRELEATAEVNRIQTRFFELIAREESVANALLRYTPTLLEFMGAAGAAICFGDQCHLVGTTPPRETIGPMTAWLDSQIDPVRAIYHTSALSSAWPAATAFHEAASGMLAVKLSRVEPHFILWFRPEVLQTTIWAGAPDKPLETSVRIHPRKSFAAWQQTVAGQSLPWSESEVRGALELRDALNALVVRRTERLLRLNAELERKNSDLNSFAYIASHDLREPLRGIHHFTKFLQEDHASQLGEEGMRKVNTIAALAAHTNDLLNALSRFSQLGRMELTSREADLNQVLDEALAAVTVSLQESGAEVRRPKPLPTVRCDPQLVREVFVNLVTNAIKYNDKPSKWVEVSFREPADTDAARGPIITVADNGIGVRERNLDAVFQMFRRLNKDQYGPGSGAGLAIVKSIVERHGGRIWLESTFGEGSTFCFTLK